ncbi:MAG: glycoside hydrolase family 3 protein [Bacteroidales bacterium]|nr:glycoside hydrolase family 3 protein [Bacteroidales bacterium]
MKKIILSSIMLCGLLFASSCSQSGSSKNEQIANDTAWKQLSLREKIGQTMMITSDLYAQKQIGEGSLETFMQKYPVGGIFIAQWHFMYQKPDTLLFETFVPRIIKEYNAASKLPLFISEDFERGAGYNYNTQTKLPVEMAIGAANDTALAYAHGKILGVEAKDLGFNWVLAPVCDLNINPLHPLVIERSVSDDAERALPLLQSQMKGLEDQNVITTVKHFPGDGATICDQHLVTSANNLSWPDWQKTYGKLFKKFIADNAPSIMVGHLRFPAYQKADTLNGDFLPATLSKELMQKLLKKELGYKGVVISDALNMGGGYGFYEDELETAVQCFIAGADVVLWPPLGYMDTIEARILRGEISMERLDDAVERVWALRERYNLVNKENRAPISQAKPENFENYVDETLTKLSEKAVTIVQNKGGQLPLDTTTTKRILLANISHNDYAYLFEPMKKELEQRGFQVDIRHDMHKNDWEWRWNQLLEYDKVIVCFENHYFEPIGSPLLKDAEAYCLWTMVKLPREKVIGVSFSNPYYNKYYLNKNSVLINAYSSDPYMQKAVVKVLMGELQPTATSPVNLDNPIMK